MDNSLVPLNSSLKNYHYLFNDLMSLTFGTIFFLNVSANSGRGETIGIWKWVKQRENLKYAKMEESLWTIQVLWWNPERLHPKNKDEPKLDQPPQMPKPGFQIAQPQLKNSKLILSLSPSGLKKQTNLLWNKILS